MEVKQIALKNFKGVEKLKLILNGNNAEIRGKNATGKTTIFDGYLWVMFDKDSSDRKDFEIKTIDATGGVIHNLEHEVSAIIEVEGKEIALRKMLKEKWTRKRGSESEEFTGHETSYWIDDLPVKKSKYEETISGIVKEDIFKLISNPAYFNENLKWQDRRKSLFEAFINIDIDLFSLNPDLMEIKEDIEKHGADNLKKITAEKRRMLNNEMEQIPVRIDEAKKSIPDLSYVPGATKGREVKILEKTKIEENIKKIEESKKDADTAVLAYRNKSTEIEKLKDKIKSEALKKYQDAKDAGTKLYYDIQGDKKTLNDSREKIGINNNKIKELEEKKINLTEKWKAINSEIFKVPDIDDFKCPTCNQALPQDDIANKIDELKSNFAKDKKSKLDEVLASGNQVKKDIESISKLNEEIEKEIAEFENAIKTKTDEMEKYVNLHKEGETVEIKYEENEEYLKVTAELNKLITTSFDDTELTELRAKKDKLTAEISELEKTIALKDIAENTEKRITELTARQKELAQEIMQIEKREFLIETYIKLKASVVEETINEKFQIVKWKLFEIQINGGINEVCVATVNNVSYPDLNTAGKIQVGLDVIRAFAGVYGINAPIFIDNAESIIDITDTGAQQIKLYVDDREEIEGFEKIGKVQFKKI